MVLLFLIEVQIHKRKKVGLNLVLQAKNNDSASTVFRIYILFFKDFIYLFLEGGEGKEKERERNIEVWLPLTCPPPADLACNPGTCPEWESNQQPFASQFGAQSTEPPARAESMYS